MAVWKGKQFGNMASCSWVSARPMSQSRGTTTAWSRWSFLSCTGGIPPLVWWVVNCTCLDILIQKKYRKYISNKFENIWDTVIGINEIFRMTSYDIWIFAEVGYYESYYTYTTCKGLPPLAARSSGTRRVPENLGLVLVQFSVWCCTPDITLPFMGSGRASKGEASPQPEAHPCWRIGICSRKFRESSAKERAKVKVHFEGGWPSKSCKNNAQSATNCLENGFHDARWMLTRLSRSDPWWFGVIWQVMNESS